MSSIFASNGMVLATAMAAVSGTVILLAFRFQKQPTTTVAGATKFSIINHPRPCISIGGTKKRVKKKKKVHFAEDVMEPSGNGEEFRKRLQKWLFTLEFSKIVAFIDWLIRDFFFISP
ncbi:unnamed protein product [Lactuca saligna]|uniref:Uncharacterized protein n=1 Tax=Lactuca saligna TaxID=75948 RepID=A0AA36EEM7_LACSI|nr:unnamed protein product [Lactuca saligna]